MKPLTDETRQKIAKVYALAERGATDGEKAAARAALDRLLKSYDLTEEALDNIELMARPFGYTWELEIDLICRVAKFGLQHADWIGKNLTSRSPSKKTLWIMLSYVDYIELSCAYEYFRRHMKAEWKKFASAELKRCRSAKTRNAKRKFLEPHFYSAYIQASGLFEEDCLRDTNYSEKEKAAARQFSDVQGGQYKTQVERSGRLIE